MKNVIKLLVISYTSHSAHILFVSKCEAAFLLLSQQGTTAPVMKYNLEKFFLVFHIHCWNFEF